MGLASCTCSQESWQYPGNAGNPSNNEHAMRDSYAEGCWGRSIAIAPGQSTMLFWMYASVLSDFQCPGLLGSFHFAFHNVPSLSYPPCHSSMFLILRHLFCSIAHDTVLPLSRSQRFDPMCHTRQPPRWRCRTSVSGFWRRLPWLSENMWKFDPKSIKSPTLIPPLPPTEVCVCVYQVSCLVLGRNMFSR